MIRRPLVLIAAIAAILGGAPIAAQAANVPATWDNLVLVKAKDLKAVYLLPGADFRPYTKIMLDPTEVDFVKGWVKYINQSYGAAFNPTDNADAVAIAKQVRIGFDQIFAKAFTKAGWQVVTEPGPDVLRLSTSVYNLFISAPNTVTTSGGSSVRTLEAGQASVLIEARDSETGQVIGRVLDVQNAGTRDENIPRNSVGNRADFGMVFDRWADICIKGIEHLKSLSPVDATGQPTKPAP
jgi:hypothetical protein